MKKIMCTALLIIVFFKFTNANNDSLSINNDSLFIDNCTEIKDSFINNIEIEKDEIKSNNIAVGKVLNTKKLASKPEGFGDFMNNLWDIISSPFKPVWGYYEEDDYNKEGPYFLFMHSSGGATYISKQLENVREKIRINGSSEKALYERIFDEAGTTTIDNCNGVIIPNPNDGSAMCGAAARAKASAFVYLVGLNSTGGPLTNTERQGYRDRALAFLRDVKIQGLNNTFDLISAIPGVGVINSIIPLSPAFIAAGLQ